MDTASRAEDNARMSEISPDSPLPAAPAPAAVVIDSDIYCSSCGYNLRSLSASANCPECNHPVWKSLQGDALRFANPAWIKKVRLGLSLVSIGAVIYGGGLIFFFFARDKLSIDSEVLAWINVGLSGYMLFSVWLLTSADPTRLYGTKVLSAAHIARSGHLLYFGFVLVARFIPAAATFRGWLTWVCIFFAFLVLWFLGYGGRLRVCANLAQRAQSLRLQAVGKFLSWAIPITGIALFGFFLGVVIQGVMSGKGPTRAQDMGPLVCVGCLPMLGAPVFLIMELVLLWRVGLAIKRELAAGEERGPEQGDSGESWNSDNTGG